MTITRLVRCHRIVKSVGTTVKNQLPHESLDSTPGSLRPRNRQPHNGVRTDEVGSCEIRKVKDAGALCGVAAAAFNVGPAVRQRGEHRRLGGKENKMHVKRMTSAVVIATGVGISALTFGAGLVNTASSDPPPPCPSCQPGPDGPETGPQDDPAPAPPANPAPKPRRVGPGSPRGGGGQPSYRGLPLAPASAGDVESVVATADGQPATIAGQSL